MAKVVHFEIPTEVPKAAMKFYSNVFDWKFQKWEGPVDYWLASTGEEGEPGIQGALTMKESPSDTVVNTIDVASIDQIMEKIEANGGKLLTPKMVVPGVGVMVYFLDPEGNKFGAMQAVPMAE